MHRASLFFLFHVPGMAPQEKTCTEKSKAADAVGQVIEVVDGVTVQENTSNQ